MLRAVIRTRTGQPLLTQWPRTLSEGLQRRAVFGRVGRPETTPEALRTNSRPYSSRPLRTEGLLDGVLTRRVLLTVVVVAEVFLAFHIFTRYFYSLSSCYGISMLPTINDYGDWVLISKRFRRGRGIEVGDVVSFEHPGDQRVTALKRVIGMPGDFVVRDNPARSDGSLIEVGLVP